ncbi:hypothetical protein [Pseudoduganella umbonata]|uniref:Adenine/guanine phosphoribosyltransferase-like PRPP-binding protein n=1 Tax=Pseudoduganella umbonata TaxID=864828 RepID=A0A7W5E864_9BURK|nr:hypothetical protein [Pseudoduganella umbonata]MBB3219796.1 adenine/guanine phosphoribosyltransferase-like PRPP-binding protein [Pseudoduganella umbonata]
MAADVVQHDRGNRQGAQQVDPGRTPGIMMRKQSFASVDDVVRGGDAQLSTGNLAGQVPGKINAAARYYKKAEPINQPND